MSVQLVGYSQIETGAGRAFIFSGNGPMQDLNDLIAPGSGWTLEQANGINNSGQIVGFGIDPTGQTDAFLLTPTGTPGPSTLALLAAGAIGLIGYGLRRRRAVRRTAKPAAFDQQDAPPILSFPSHSFRPAPRGTKCSLIERGGRAGGRQGRWSSRHGPGRRQAGGEAGRGPRVGPQGNGEPAGGVTSSFLRSAWERSGWPLCGPVRVGGWAELDESRPC